MKTILYSLITKLLIVSSSLTLFTQAQAQSVTFMIDDFDLYSYQSEIEITVSGLTLYLSNPNSPTGLFLIDYDGIFLSGDEGYGETTSFHIRFSDHVTFDFYEIGYVWGTGSTFDLSNPSGPGSLNNTTNSTGIHNFNTPFTLHAGQTAVLNAQLPDIDYLFHIKAIGVTVVPEPSTYLALVGATILAAFTWQRQKRRAGHP